MTASPEEFDSEVPAHRCGYAFPEGSDEWRFIHEPSQQNSCIRSTLPDADRCAFHADPTETEHKLKQLTNSTLVGNSLDGVILSDQFANEVELSGSSLLREADLSGASLDDADLREANLRNADLSGVSLDDADLRAADLAGADLPGASLDGADLREADLTVADLQEAELVTADLREASLSSVTLQEADLRFSDLSKTYMDSAQLGEARLSDAELRDANLFDAYLSEASLRRTDLSEVVLTRADLSGAGLSYADLSGADLSRTDLSEANLEQATVVGVNLFDADLTQITPYGARIEGCQINDGTDFHRSKKEYTRLWHRLPLVTPPPRCGYDPVVWKPEQDDDTDGATVDTDQDPPSNAAKAADRDRETLLTQAADTYRQFEQLARQNTHPSLQSSFFVLRQDMQRKRYWERNKYTQWLANRVFRVVFKHGESFSRVLWTAGILIGLFAGVYWQLDLIIANPDAPSSDQRFVTNPFDALYFSTLTFTTLGLGDFQPAATSELGRGLVLLQAVLGAILIATFVFVLGRRAAR